MMDAVINANTKLALTILGTDGLTYRKGNIGPWLPIVGAKFHAAATQIISYDDTHKAIVAPATAHLKVYTGGTVLQVMSSGNEWQVKEADNTVWAVIGQSRHLGQTFYALTRVVTISNGNDRGTAP